ncbi:MAG: tRNA (adenosine(37)-N6)-dimethylallyltransferase MiaA [Nitriliruptorales bacterium]|nr:tRNA (adenosine(37)-N6)-dimethylallyltransferase MiaA [Nitriliruptorales bacterium]
MDSARPTHRVLALVGPTAAGKSALALMAAQRLGAEIVAVDAFTVYRGMDIGTAKASSRERAVVPHHLVDVLEPSQECSVSWFQQAARAAIAGILERDGLPLLVGGSGLYFRAVVDRLEFPPTDPVVRAEVTERLGSDAVRAHAALVDRDPEAAAVMDPTNLRRTIRALEVIELTGRPFSDWRRAWDDFIPIYPNLFVVGVQVPRARLVARIEARVDAMISRGLAEECAVLRLRELSRTARQAIGYAEMFAHLEGRLSQADAVERIKVRTRRFAARQARWFAADPRVRWRAPSDVLEVLALR